MIITKIRKVPGEILSNWVNGRKGPGPFEGAVECEFKKPAGSLQYLTYNS